MNQVQKKQNLQKSFSHNRNKSSSQQIKLFTYFSQKFPRMPTWINIQSVMIVQPNGEIICKYTQQNNNLFANNNYQASQQPFQPHQNNLPSNTQKKVPPQQSLQKRISQQKKAKLMNQLKLKEISQKVIESSRKLFKSTYGQINKIIVRNNLVYYRFKYNVLVIVQVKKFSVSPQQIQTLIQTIFHWYEQKCNVWNIELKLPNTKLSSIQINQFRKLQWQIAHQIQQKKQLNMNLKQKSLKQSSQKKHNVKVQYIKDNMQEISRVVDERDEDLLKIKQKMNLQRDLQRGGRYVVEEENQSYNNKTGNRIVQLLLYFIRAKPRETSSRLKRQLSYKQNTYSVKSHMKIKLVLLYLCVIVTVVLATMIYFGWFRE